MIEFVGKFDSTVTQNLNNRFFKKHWWAYLALSAVIIVIGICGIILKEDSSDVVMGIIFIVLGLAITPITLVITRIMQKRIDKSMHIMSSDTIDTYRFYPDKLVITQKKGDEYEAITTTRYSYLYSVEETAERYFLFVSKLQSHVVNKADLTQGSIEELNVILHANLGNKFKSLK